MTSRAFFGRPQPGFSDGGTHITVYLVPVYDGRLVVFDVSAKEARGRWLPWNVLPFQENPYVAASELADEWCAGMVRDLRLADVMSFEMPGGGWELAIVFRADLTGEPPGDEVRTPFIFERGQFDAIGWFDPVDLQRWVGPAPADGEAERKESLLF